VPTEEEEEEYFFSKIVLFMTECRKIWQSQAGHRRQHNPAQKRYDLHAK